MSRGTGRIEKAVLTGVFSEFALDGRKVKAEEICRVVYPDAEKIEKKHRVAVLRTLHNLAGRAPRADDHRNWTIQSPRPGYWWRISIPNFDPAVNDYRWYEEWGGAAYHEAGHALAALYFGRIVNRIKIHTGAEKLKQWEKAKGTDEPEITVGYVRHRKSDLGGRIEKPMELFQDVIVCLAGCVAQAHRTGLWPYKSRGISGTYCSLFEDGGRHDSAEIDSYLAVLSPDNTAQRVAIKRQALNLAQALVRSPQGWRFIQALVTKLRSLRSSTITRASTAERIFFKAFGRPPPHPGAWTEHWPPKLYQVRCGWLPP